jgi:hypothetical protein
MGMQIHGMIGFQRFAADRHAEIRALAHGGDLKRLAYPDLDRLALLLAELRAIGDGPYAAEYAKR